MCWVVFVIWYKRLSWHTLFEVVPFCIISINSINSFSFSFTRPTHHSTICLVYTTINLATQITIHLNSESHQ